jgi:transposase
MKRLVVADAETVVLALQDEIRRSRESRYDHRLHGLLLVAQGMSCGEVGQLLGDAPRTVEYWVKRFEQDGLAGLVDGERSGRPPRLTARQLEAVEKALRESPHAYGLGGNLWDGRLLAAFTKKRFGVSLGIRQCQRMFRRFGFRLRKPRPHIAGADLELQRHHKKKS